MKSINIGTGSNFKGRFYLLDLARAFAAICVVLQHYQHFYSITPYVYQDNFLRIQQPFYEIIKPFYQFGSVAVQFFFILSGFIFFLCTKIWFFQNLYLLKIYIFKKLFKTKIC